jgi:phosphatidylglycerophosphate synthase
MATRFTYSEIVQSCDPITNWSKFIVHPISDRLLWLIANFAPVHPNVLTILSFILGLISAAFYLEGTYIGFLFGALFFYLSFCLDTIDGALARLLQKSSHVGAWLDLLTDFLRSGLLSTTFSIGCYRMTGDIRALILGFSLVMISSLFYFLGQLSVRYAGDRPSKLVSGSSWASRLKKIGLVPNPLGMAEFEALYLIIFPIAQYPILGMAAAVSLGGLSRIVVVWATFAHLRRKDCASKTAQDSH